MYLNKLAACFIIASLGGCATTDKSDNKSLTIVPSYSENIAIPKVQPTNLRPISWQVVNNESLLQIANNPKNKLAVLYLMNDEQMNTLSGNMDDILRYIREQNAVISYLTGLITLRPESTTKDDK